MVTSAEVVVTAALERRLRFWLLSPIELRATQPINGNDKLYSVFGSATKAQFDVTNVQILRASLGARCESALNRGMGKMWIRW